MTQRRIAGLNDPALARGFSSLQARVVPDGILGRATAAAAVRTGDALPLVGGPLAFSRVRLVWRDGDAAAEAAVALNDARGWAEKSGDAAAFESALATLAEARPALLGLAAEVPALVGVLNVTPDSFSDGGRFESPTAAIDHGLAMIDAGAHVIDIGGESTRPGAETIPAKEQCRRVIPVVETLAEKAPVSIDTRDATVMRAALDAGARIVNDVSALTVDPAACDVVAEAGCPVILMHSRATPKTMQNKPDYRDVRLDTYDYLEARVAACVDRGIPRNLIVCDPGIGFGHTDVHIAWLMRDLAILHGLGTPLMLGASRKSFISRVDRDMPADRRVPGSLAAALHGASRGIQFLRVHDVDETRQALAIGGHFDVA